MMYDLVYVICAMIPYHDMLHERLIVVYVGTHARTHARMLHVVMHASHAQYAYGMRESYCAVKHAWGTRALGRTQTCMCAK